MAYAPVSQDTPWQNSDSLDLSTTALLVIDVLGGDSGLPEGFEEEAGNCVRLADAARVAGVPVIFCNDAHIPAYDRELELWGEHGVAGTEGATPLAEFGDRSGDVIIPKRRYDAFFQTDLDLTLRELGIDTVVAVGCDANICVLHTLAGAYYRGYRSIVAADAVWTFLVGTLNGALEHMSACFDTRVSATAELLEKFGA